MGRSIIWLTACIFLLLQAGSANAQKRNAHWFLPSTWVTFQSGTPGLVDAPIPGTIRASLSDTTGDLRVYYRVYPSSAICGGDHVPINNHPSLDGIYGSYQSAVFVPKPGDPESCFLLVWRRLLETEERHWGILEIHLGPLGNQPVAIGGIQWFMTNALHKSMVVPHANGEDYWFVTQERVTFAHHAYRVSAGGIIGPPIIGPVGTVLQPNQEYGILVPSRSGQRFISTNEYYSLIPPVPTEIGLYSFNPATGAMDLTTELPELLRVCGAEFSPGSRFLYVADKTSVWLPGAIHRLFQYDLEAENLLTSRVLVDSTLFSTGFANTTSALHLAPDGKIYRAYDSQVTYLGVIEAPNEVGAACGFVEQGFQCLGQVLSLPSFAKHYHDDPGPGALSTPELQRPDHARIGPNPMSGEGWLHWPGVQGAVELEWLDLRGRVVRQVKAQGSDGRVPVHVGDLAQGAYLLRCRSTAGQQTVLRLVVAP